MDITDFCKVYLDLALKHLVEDRAPGNSVLAAQWLGRAAGNGNADAQRLLGRMYALGQGVPKNAAAAERWLGKAAAQSIPEALSDLQIFSRHRAAVQEDAGPPLFEAVTTQQILEAKNRAG